MKMTTIVKVVDETSPTFLADNRDNITGLDCREFFLLTIMDLE